MGSNKTDIVLPEIKFFQRRSSHGARRGRSLTAAFSTSTMMMMRSSDSSAPYAAAWAQDIDEEEDEENTIRVLISGFGPFRDHTVNASWEAVKIINPDDIILLSRHGRDMSSTADDFMANQPTIQITFCELEVVYNTIHQVIPDLWEKYKPHLVVHVGVSGIAKAITLEQNAHNSGYCSPDIKEVLPRQNQCVAGGCERLESGLNMTNAMRKVNTVVATYGTRGGLRSSVSGYPSIPNTIRAEVSNDPGRFLCDFIYYRSLSIDKDRTAFIHVPPLGKPYNANELALAISLCISEFIQQLHEKKLLH